MFTPSLSLLALLASPVVEAAEVTGQLRGEVLDADGLAIPGVTVTVKGPNLIGGATASTNEDGAFRLPAIPAGEYILEARKDGFLPYRATGVRVATGQTTGLDIALKLAVGGAEIDIEEVKPALDTQRVSSGAVMSRETLRDIPNAGRSYQSATAFAPGVVGSGNVNARGGFDNGNQFYVDGVNNTDPTTGTFSQNMNFDAIEELQVVTGGMDAEYGRSLGGAINIITRSGGDEFSGNAQILYSSEKTRWFTPLEGESTDTAFSASSLALNLGGPIVKGRLWFFASVQGDLRQLATPVDDAVGRPADQPMAPRDWKSGYYFTKLTWRPSDQHRVWWQIQGDPAFIENVEQSPYTLPAGETIQEQGGFVTSLGHLWTPSEKDLVQTQLYFQKSRIDYYSVACKDAPNLADCTRNLDNAWQAYSPDAFSAGQFPYAYLGKRYRASATSSWTRFFSFLGEHQAKAGVQGEYILSDDIFPGVQNILYKDPTASPQELDSYENAYLLAYDNELEAKLSGTLASAYIQDIWTPVERLTLRPGLRFDYAALKNDVGEMAFSSGTFSPRFGAAYDLTNDGRTSLHGYYGRFYDTGFLAVSDLMNKRSNGYSYYAWDAEAGDWGADPIYRYAPYTLVHDDLKNPYSDEFDLGIGRDVGDGWAVDATFTYERASRFWEDDEVNLIWNDDGTDVVGYRNGTNEAIFRIRTPDKAFTEYTSLELTTTRQFDNFGLLGSYTWSRAYGTNDSQFATGTFDIPAQAPYETGLLSYDRTHAIKVAGSWRDADVVHLTDTVSLGFLAGWNFQMFSGFPYRPVYYNPYYQDWVNYRNALDDTYRTPAFSQTDLKTGMTVQVGKTKFDVTAECFNVFNDRTVESVDSTYGNEAGDGAYLGDDGFPLFGRPLTRQDPRYFQLGLRGEF